ncbi:Rpn family recombination-promoting nuclease/putative transposase [Myroides guanonis]|uniref:Transposase/invertase (TIGR01784 family) n=1 Tax=Myroides guanonis TaxID=1150112 RepID=A0A1I3PKW6_9FLAO|nr:Rpn family recombination-promoting nuclease/putative transposase [Myroides guanonis]SFJ22009.1 conserved hypothetical protein (putative transposase or invertase) [Myroides guanonis]
MSKSKNNLGKYVGFSTDWSFKFYFGREENKTVLISFLNGLFAGQKVIKDLNYRSVEHDGDIEEDRRVVFDLYCICENGEHIIIEMQQVSQDFFKDRTVFYTSRLINRLVSKGYKGNSYELPEVYFIGVLEFKFEDAEPDKYLYDVALCDKENNSVFYEKLGYKLLVLPNFNKEGADIKTDMDQWLYLLKNLSKLDKIPSFLDKRIFGLIFDIGEVAKLKTEDKMNYEASLKRKRDAESIRLTQERIAREREQNALEKGMEKGMELEKRALAIKFKGMGISIKDIAKGTGLSIEEIEKL